MNIRSLYRKLYIVLILSGVLAISFSYLLLSGKTMEIDSPEASTSPTSTSEINTPTPISTETPSPTPSNTPEIISEDTTSNDSLLRIINKKQTIEPDYVPSDLVDVPVSQYSHQKLRQEAASSLEEMFKAASDDGIELYLISGYRSYTKQQELQNYYRDTLGDVQADRIDCIPGSSEHQIGLAVDLGTVDHKYELDTDFSKTEAYQWLISHCSEYGYILRYPEGKEEVTGIKFSPWNFRYVGNEYSTKITESGLTMEEYFQ